MKADEHRWKRKKRMNSMKVDGSGWKYLLCYMHLWCRFPIRIPSKNKAKITEQRTWFVSAVQLILSCPCIVCLRLAEAVVKNFNVSVQLQTTCWKFNEASFHLASTIEVQLCPWINHADPFGSGKNQKDKQSSYDTNVPRRACLYLLVNDAVAGAFHPRHIWKWGCGPAPACVVRLPPVK